MFVRFNECVLADTITGRSCEKTAFIMPGRGLFELVRKPFGLINAAQVEQLLKGSILRQDLELLVFVCLHGIVIISKSFEEHCFILRKVRKRIKKAGLTVNANKGEFAINKLNFLGFVVDELGLRTYLNKVSTIVQYSRFKTATKVKIFICMTSWYRRFVSDFATIVSPSNGLLKGKMKQNVLDWIE